MYPIPIKMIVLFSFLFVYPLANAEGFAAGTLVKIPDGYVRIENINVGDQVVCFDASNQYVVGTVTNVSKKTVDSYIRIGIANENMCVACDQQLYDEKSNSWVASVLKSGDILAGHAIAVEVINEAIDVYLLTIAQHHNFFVTTQDVCAHNFIPLVVGISIAFGSGALELAGFSAGIAGLGAYLGYKWHKKSEQKHTFIIESQLYGNGMMPEDPEEEKKKKRDEARNNYESLNNQEARELAEKMGFKIDKNPPFKPHGKLVFRKGNTYISADRTGHKGGIWKVFKKGEGRLGTWNVDLTKRVGD